MRARVGFAAAVAVALVIVAVAPAAPPPGLTQHAKVVWNVDALVRDKFGSQRVCIYRYAYLNVGSGYCASEYTFTFAAAKHSTFRLISRASNPLAGPDVNATAIEFYGSNGPYVYCGHNQWLAVVNAHSQNWPIACVSP